MLPLLDPVERFQLWNNCPNWIAVLERLTSSNEPPYPIAVGRHDGGGRSAKQAPISISKQKGICIWEAFGPARDSTAFLVLLRNVFVITFPSCRSARPQLPRLEFRKG